MVNVRALGYVAAFLAIGLPAAAARVDDEAARKDLQAEDDEWVEAEPVGAREGYADYGWKGNRTLRVSPGNDPAAAITRRPEARAAWPDGR